MQFLHTINNNHFNKNEYHSHDITCLDALSQVRRYSCPVEFQIYVNSSYYDRANWPIEHEVNFTSFLSSLDKSETFNASSIRIYEQDSSGNILQEVSYQFDQASDYDASSNAKGTLIFFQMVLGPWAKFPS